jgi:hypothetical protein
MQKAHKYFSFIFPKKKKKASQVGLILSYKGSFGAFNAINEVKNTKKLDLQGVSHFFKRNDFEVCLNPYFYVSPKQKKESRIEIIFYNNLIIETYNNQHHGQHQKQFENH